MKPIYFPFTYISGPILDALYAYFGKIAVYGFSEKDVPEKMRKGVENGKLDINMPVKMDEKKLASILKDHKIWANLHHMDRGGELTNLKTHGKITPFIDDFAMSRIKKDIKERGAEMHPKADQQESVDPFFTAGIFLYLAGEYDMQNDEISGDLISSEKMERKLITDIKGENDELFKEMFQRVKRLSDDTGHFMTSERMAAWTYMMQHDQEMPGFFITSSRSVFEHLIDNATEAEVVSDFSSIPLNKNRIEETSNRYGSIADYIDTLLKNAWPISNDNPVDPPLESKSDKKASLVLYIIPGKSPREFFARFAGHDMLRLEKEKGDTAHKNTIIGLVEISDIKSHP